MKKTKFITFFNQKGGVGKSTLTTMFASHVHYHTNTKIAVIDADNLQHSILEKRLEDREEDITAANLSYPVENIPSDMFLNTYNNEDAIKNYDIILVDLPGNLWQDGVIETLACMDMIIIPTGFSDVEITSTNKFTEIFDNHIAPARKKFNSSLSATKMLMCFNRVNKRVKEAQDYLNARDEDYLKTVVPDSVVFQRGFTTVGEYQHYRQKNLVTKFCKEVLAVIKTL